MTKFEGSYSERTIYKNVETLASSDAAVAKHLGKAVYTVDEVNN
jgi:hypothetical protein